MIHHPPGLPAAKPRTRGAELLDSLTPRQLWPATRTIDEEHFEGLVALVDEELARVRRQARSRGMFEGAAALVAGFVLAMAVCG